MVDLAGRDVGKVQPMLFLLPHVVPTDRRYQHLYCAAYLVAQHTGDFNLSVEALAKQGREGVTLRY